MTELIATLAAVVVATMGLVLYLRARKREKDKARCHSCPDADCPGNVCPVHPQPPAPPKPVILAATRPAVAADPPMRVELRVRDQEGLPSSVGHAMASAIEAHQQQQMERMPDMTPLFEGLDRTLQDMTGLINRAIQQPLDGIGQLMNQMQHIQEDYQALQAAGVQANHLRGYSSRAQALQRLLATHRITELTFNQMAARRDHNDIPNWVGMMRDLLSGRARSSTDQSEAGSLFSYYQSRVLTSSYTAAPLTSSYATATPPEAPKEPEDTKPAPSRFDRDDIIDPGVEHSMWVRFWYKSNCPSNPPEESTYEWFDRDSSDDCLDDTAREMVPSWAEDSERGFKYGFERVDKPPPEELGKLLQRWTNTVEHASRMLRIVNEELAR